MKKTLLFASTLLALPAVSYASPYFSLQDGDGFKRFSVSVGALHVMPQGKAQPFRVNTAIQNGYTADVGEVQSQTVKDNYATVLSHPYY